MRNRKKLWQERTVHLYRRSEMWRQFAGRTHTELTNASIAVHEYEREMNALLDEAEAERDWYREAWHTLLPST